ncbi:MULTISPECIES: hypothetical protein [unclassified Burkholderia]|uniref:hypothetical protein n=1 Tax=unclassified Burkholderia TaxID=2613784 RepID=UPI00117CE477|nr:MULTISPECIES: hypothetical protein [unclassified Burkholderia]MDN7427244.1 hypothetical protein [Burkholderia sp. AU45388]
METFQPRPVAFALDVAANGKSSFVVKRRVFTLNLHHEDMEMPKSVENYDLRCWMLVNQLSYIKKNKDDRNEGVEWFVDEVNYYRKNDEFRT